MAPAWIYRVASALDRALQSFEASELAYLALTGKIELPLRDRLAWQLQLSYPSPPYFTVREWHKTDIAVVKDGDPIVLLEAKALYTFDAVNPNTLAKYAGYIDGDITKARQLAVSDTQMMVAVFMTHVGVPVSAELDGIVKYRHGINKALLDLPDPQALRAHALETVEGWLRDLGTTQLVAPSSIAEAFDIPVRVDAWVTCVDGQ